MKFGKFQFNIGTRLWLGFGLLITAFIITTLVTYVSLKNSEQLSKSISTQHTPTIVKLENLNILVLRSNILMSNWLQENRDETPRKLELKDLHKDEYDNLKEDLLVLSKEWDRVSKNRINTTFRFIEDSLFAFQKDMMANFSTELDYYNPEKLEQLEIVKNDADESRDSRIKSITSSIESIIEIQKSHLNDVTSEMGRSFKELQSLFVYLGLTLVIIGISTTIFTRISIVRPINNLKGILQELSKGIIPSKDIEEGKDEIGEMATAMKHLVTSLSSTSEFSKQIGEGKFDAHFEPLSEKDILGNSLLIMRDNLAKVAEEDKKRSWTSEGLAMFGQILRQNNDDLKKLNEEIILALVQYLNANQGAIFIKQAYEDAREDVMVVGACYAWDRHKFLEQRIIKGDGLVGQCWQERNTFYLTDIPQDYIRISSGLGNALPTSLLLVPMITNNETYGVLEISSFEELQTFEIEFVEKLAETIAMTISTVTGNEQTRILLEQTQKATEQMRAQEEELRQNQEEMLATQEEMQRNLKDSKLKIVKHEQTEASLKEENKKLRQRIIELEKNT